MAVVAVDRVDGLDGALAARGRCGRLVAVISPEIFRGWEDLSSNEKTALRHLAKGEVYDVPARMIRRLAALGLTDGSPEGRLTPAGLEMYRTRPTGRWK